jgi:hypothetical protein
VGGGISEGKSKEVKVLWERAKIERKGSRVQSLESRVQGLEEALDSLP